MSHYKHIYNAINNTLHHLKQAQECCDDLKEIDKVACGSWKKELKSIEKQLNGCCKTIEGKHKKASNQMKAKTASVDEELFNDDWDLEYDEEDYDYMGYWEDEQEKHASTKLRLKKLSNK